MRSGARRVATRPLRLTTAGLLVLGVTGGLLSGCSTVVEVNPPAHVKECEPATARWPAKVADQPTRAVSDRAGRTGDAWAWGDTAIDATCGWPALGPTDNECLDIDGLYWVVEPLRDGVKFTTFGRDPAIEVLVPDAYEPEPLLLPVFGPAVRALPTNGLACR